MPAPKTPSKLTVDFSKVEERREGGRAAHVPEGDYLLQVKGCSLQHKKDDESSKYLRWIFAIVKPSTHSHAGSVYHNTTLREEGLWSLRNLLEDLGIRVPKAAVDLPLAAIVKKAPMVGATLQDSEPYNDKIKSEIAATFKASEYTEEGATAAETSDEETEDEEEEDEDVEELDVDDL